MAQGDCARGEAAEEDAVVRGGACTLVLHRRVASRILCRGGRGRLLPLALWRRLAW